MRRTYHFRCAPGKTVEAGSKEAAAIVGSAISQKDKDLFLLGVGLHAFEDSWSHEGFGTVHGRLFPNPDLAANDVPNAEKMAAAAYAKLDAWRQKHSPDSKPVKTFDMILGTKEKPGPLLTLFRRDDNLAKRVELWKAQISDDFKVKVNYDDKGKDDPWATFFWDAAKTVQPPKAPEPPAK